MKVIIKPALLLYNWINYFIFSQTCEIIGEIISSLTWNYIFLLSISFDS